MGDADGGGTERAPRANAEAFVASIILSSRADCSASLASRLPASHSMAKATVLPGFPGWGATFAYALPLKPLDDFLHKGLAVIRAMGGKGPIGLKLGAGDLTDTCYRASTSPSATRRSPRA